MNDYQRLWAGLCFLFLGFWGLGCDPASMSSVGEPPMGEPDAAVGETDATRSDSARTDSARNPHADAATQDAGAPPDRARGTVDMDGWCGTGDWAACVDFDGLGTAEEGGRRGMTQADEDALEIEYWGYDVGNVYREDGPVYELECKSTLSEGGNCDPIVEDGRIRVNSESRSFGLAMVRLERPIEFVDPTGDPDASGDPATRHIHFESSLVWHGRLFIALHISEMPAAGIPDLRLLDSISSSADAGRGLTLRMSGNTQYGIKATHWNPAHEECTPSSPASSCWDQTQLYQGRPDFHIDPLDPELRDQMHDVDVYLSRTHIRILIDGEELVDTDIADIGFDRGYVSVASVSYNPLKDAGGRPDWRGERMSSLFDNFAFDGRPIDRNGLLPEGQEMFVFHTRAATSCTIAGTFEGMVAPHHDGAWNPVYTLVPEGSGPFSESDISCSHREGTRNNAYNSLRMIGRGL